MFDGLDDIDWASLEHAYGPAAEVPDLIRGLIDPDPATREESLDAMYGAVHHQGDVYDSTVAAVPFLIEALTTSGLPGRDGVANLLASVGDLSEWSPEGDGYRLKAAAHDLAGAAAPDLAVLLDDPDPALRAAVAPLLVAVADRLPDLAGRLIARFRAEADDDVRRVLLEQLGRVPGEAAADLLRSVAAGAPRASTAVAALAAAARQNPATVPLDGAVDLLERAYAEDAPPAEPAGFSTNTLIGSIRQHTERTDAGRRAPHAARLIEALTDPLGPRVAERIAILGPLLRSPHPDLAGDALFGAKKLIDRWRGDHRPIVDGVAGLLTCPDPEVAERAARFLGEWYDLVAPVADRVADRLAEIAAEPEREGLPAWIHPYRSGPHGLHPLIRALAHLGDERALPYLLRALDLPRRPRDVTYLLGRFPGRADEVVRALLPRLAEIPELWAALRRYGAAAAPAVPHLLAIPPDEFRVTTLGLIGPAAADAVPALRTALADGDPRLAVAAAGALWRIERSPAVLPALVKAIDGPAGVTALETIAEIGPDAASTTPYLATLLDRPDRYWWQPMRAALAWWRAGGDAERARPVLTAAWNGNERTRLPIATAVTGDLAAGLRPLFAEELAQARRHGLSETGYSSDQIYQDEQLLTALRRF